MAPIQGSYLPCLPQLLLPWSCKQPPRKACSIPGIPQLSRPTLFTRIRMLSSLAVGLAVCRQFSMSRDPGNRLLLRILPTTPPSSILHITLWTRTPKVFTVPRSQKMREHSTVQAKQQRSIIRTWEGEGKSHLWIG